MKQQLITGPLCHDFVILIIRERWPHLVHGTDYLVQHPIDDDGNQRGAPYFAKWNAADIPQPDIEELDAAFQASAPTYRAALARHYRDSFLSWSDPMVAVLEDAPTRVRPDVDVWKRFRQALRDVPQQSGFPMEIQWPDLPEAAAAKPGT